MLVTLLYTDVKNTSTVQGIYIFTSEHIRTRIKNLNEIEYGRASCAIQRAFTYGALSLIPCSTIL